MTDRELLGWVKIDEVRQHFDTANCGTIYKTGGEGQVPLYTAPPKPEPMIDGWPLYSGLPPQEEQGLTATPLPAIKLKDERVIDKSMAKRIATQLGWEPKREGVGLTDEEVEGYWDWEDFQCGAGRSTILEMVRDIEAKLKEKNNG